MTEKINTAAHRTIFIRCGKMASMETNLEDLRNELQDQEERNQELQDRITDQ